MLCCYVAFQSSIMEREIICQNPPKAGRVTHTLPVVHARFSIFLRFCFNSQFLDAQQFYTSLDTQFLVDILRSEVAYIKNCWQGTGRPVITINLTSTLLGKKAPSSFKAPCSTFCGVYTCSFECCCFQSDCIQH